jgi:hypothetical protein
MRARREQFVHERTEPGWLSPQTPDRSRLKRALNPIARNIALAASLSSPLARSAGAFDVDRVAGIASGQESKVQGESPVRPPRAHRNTVPEVLLQRRISASPPTGPWPGTIVSASSLTTSSTSPTWRDCLERERRHPEEAQVAGEQHVDVGDEDHHVAVRCGRWPGATRPAA